MGDGRVVSSGQTEARADGRAPATRLGRNRRKENLFKMKKKEIEKNKRKKEGKGTMGDEGGAEERGARRRERRGDEGTLN